jgi:putative ABC transport system permease protein
MNLQRVISRSFVHYLRANIMASAGLAVAVAVITGAFIIGDSLGHSLERAVSMRLGNITHSVTAGDRLFTMKLPEILSKGGRFTVSAGMIAEGMAVAEGGRERLNKIQVVGVDEKFGSVLGTEFEFNTLHPGEVVISENLARRLKLGIGDFFQLRMKRAGVIPANTPLVSDADQSVSRRVRVAAVAANEDYGRFNIRVSQTAPFNVFVDVRWLNMVMGLEDMANIIFISSPESGTDVITGNLLSSWGIEDVNLVLRQLPGQGGLELSSERVFIEEHVSSRIGTLFPGSREFLSYFVNSIGKGEKSTPYSFVTAGNDYNLLRGETIINRWLADDLSATVGDTLLIQYWETGPLRELTERETWLIVKSIAEMHEVAGDTLLMPHLPGLSDAGNCRDWDAGVPVILDRIREKDEDYWTHYRGTPKAYISMELGQQLWSNRFGNLTSVFLPVGIDDQAQVRAIIKNAIDPLYLGLRVNELRERGLESAAGGVDFGILFGGLGFFVMLAGVMLFFLLIVFHIEKRGDQIKLFSSLGYPAKLIKKIYLGEGLLVAMAGSAAGLILAVIYARAVFWALSRLWQDIVRTDLLELVVRPVSLITGFLIGIVIAFLVILYGLNRHILTKTSQKVIAGQIPGNRKKVRYRLILALTLILAGAFILMRQLISGAATDPVSFFAAGGLLLPAFLLLADILLLQLEEKNYPRISMKSLSMKNLSRNRSRSLSVIILIALGMFVVIATGSNRKDAASGEAGPLGGTGGFMFVAEATVPVLNDLNSTDTRLALNIPQGITFVQMMASYADDASCLNLNQVANPRILSVNPSLLRGRFSFAKGTKWLDEVDPWQSLDMEIGRAIPAIADESVIQWGMGKKVGDTLTYTNHVGEEINLLLVGGLKNSIFQGNVIISERQFHRQFPETGGSTFFLAEAPHSRREEIREELGFIFRDHGWEMTTAIDRLNEFNSVENTYLGIFLMLGALGILLGVIGLAVVMARSVTERKSEIALYTSLGYKRSQITALILREYVVLLVAGLAVGIPPAIIASLPSFLSGNQTVNLVFLAFLTAAILINGLIWIAVTARLMIGNINVTASLRND